MYKVLEKLYTIGRHYFISVLHTAQYLYGIQPTCRANADYAVLGQSNQQSTAIMADEYQFGNIERKYFIQKFKKMTCKKSFMVINCNSVENNDNLDSIYFAIKCPPEFVDMK